MGKPRPATNAGRFSRTPEKVRTKQQVAIVLRSHGLSSDRDAFVEIHAEERSLVHIVMQNTNAIIVGDFHVANTPRCPFNDRR